MYWVGWLVDLGTLHVWGGCFVWYMLKLGGLGG